MATPSPGDSQAMVNARGITPLGTSSGDDQDKAKDKEGRSKASGEGTHSQLDNAYPQGTTMQWTHPQLYEKPLMTRRKKSIVKLADALSAGNKDISHGYAQQRRTGRLQTTAQWKSWTMTPTSTATYSTNKMALTSWQLGP